MLFFIRSFRVLPVTLFRINAGKKIKVRDLAVKKRGSFDVVSVAGKVQPKALHPATYTAPNGISMRPLGPTWIKVVETFKGRNVVVYGIARGTPLPDDLILVHEYDDHYSLQPAREMTLEELNDRATNFLKKNGVVYTRDDWLSRFGGGGRQ